MNWRSVATGQNGGAVSPEPDFKTTWLQRWTGASLVERSEMLAVVGAMLRGCGLLTAEDLSRITMQGFEGLTVSEKELFVKKISAWDTVRRSISQGG